jgi:hypothetical protein
MALMSSELYDALLDAGASEEKSRKAAEAVAQQENRFASLEQRMVTVEGKIDTLRAELRGELAWIKWMLGTVIVLVLGVLWKVVKL